VVLRLKKLGLRRLCNLRLAILPFHKLHPRAVRPSWLPLTMMF